MPSCQGLWKMLGLCVPKREMPVSPQAVVTLRTQYRMCADIMALANKLTYEGQLRCGSSLVEQGMLSLTAAIPESLPGWLRQASAHMHTSS